LKIKTLIGNRLQCDAALIADFPQVYHVEDILTNFPKDNRGAAIVNKLKQGEYYTRKERIFMFKVLGKYLMNNCKV